MRYFRNTVTDVVFGYEPDQEDLIAQAEADADFEEITGAWPPAPVLEEPGPVEVEPARIACALRVPVVDGEVQQIGGPYRIIGLSMLDVGTFLAIFSQNLGPDEPFVIPNNGVSISIAEWGEDYAVIEIRDHAGGSLITPASFGFSLYQF